MLPQERLCGLDAACALHPRRELHALVGHLPLERRNLRVQLLGRLRSLGGIRDLSLELRDLGGLGLERRLVVGRAVVCLVRHLLRAVLLGVFVPESSSPVAPCTALPSRAPSIAGPLSSERAQYMRNARTIRYGHCPVVSRAGLLGCEDQERWID